MRWYSMVAIYFIMWFLCLFLVLPFHARGDGREVAKVRGEADGAPPSVRPWRVILQTSLLTAALFGLYYANYVHGWVKLADLDITPAEFRQP